MTAFWGAGEWASERERISRSLTPPKTQGGREGGGGGMRVLPPGPGCPLLQDEEG